MTVEQNLRMVDAAHEAINDQDWDHLYGLHMDNVVMSVPDFPDPMKGRDAVQARLQAWAEALPDLTLTRLRGFGQGDWVCMELLISGTHKGPLRHGLDEGILEKQDDALVPATGRRIEIRACAVYKVEGAEISESHIYYDQLNLMKQLGLVP
ncbi:MAG TPA: ester cyclase [Thermoplasmata archaeon]|jgi:ketosteroid isomerase-like protein|nr:ester cyclase [Thermoplasmata archaeon]